MPLNTDALGADKPSLFEVCTACAGQTCEAGFMQLEDGWNEPTAFLSDQGMLTNEQILSVVLSAAVRSSNAQAATGSLLQRCGTLNAVLKAPGRALATTSGAGPARAALLKAVHGLMPGTLENEVTGRPVPSCWDDLMNYVRAIFDGERVEAFHVLFFGQDNALIADEKMARGTVDCVAIYPRKVVRRALELNATAVVLVHNHPGGASNASRQDIQLTANLVKALGYQGISVVDHVIVGDADCTSFRIQGLLAGMEDDQPVSNGVIDLSSPNVGRSTAGTMPAVGETSGCPGRPQHFADKPR